MPLPSAIACYHRLRGIPRSCGNPHLPHKILPARILAKKPSTCKHRFARGCLTEMGVAAGDVVVGLTLIEAGSDGAFELQDALKGCWR